MKYHRVKQRSFPLKKTINDKDKVLLKIKNGITQEGIKVNHQGGFIVLDWSKSER